METSSLFEKEVPEPLAARIRPRNLEEIVLGLDELEAMRLADLEGLYQAEAAAQMGVSRQTLSFEARLAQIRDMRGPLETDLIVYGRLPLMIFENCAIRRQHGGKCSCQNGVTYLTDRRKERFPLLNEFGCRNTLLNSRPLCLREDFARLGVQTARLQFTIESPEECVRIARAFLSGAPLDGEFTNGLYKRGVE